MSHVKIARANLPNLLPSSDSGHGPIGICNSPGLVVKKRRVAELCADLVLICCYVLEPSSCHLLLQCFVVRDQEWPSSLFPRGSKKSPPPIHITFLCQGHLSAPEFDGPFVKFCNAPWGESPENFFGELTPVDTPIQVPSMYVVERGFFEGPFSAAIVDLAG